jgi:hypothetical protein
MPKITLFTAPKPFTDPHIDLIQRNAIQSWLQLEEEVDVILVGEEEGLAEVVKEYNVAHLPNVKKNEWGTPYVNSIFQLARQASQNELLAYVNADIIIMPDFLDVVRKVQRKEDQFLIVGRRWNLRVEEEIDFDGNWVEALQAEVNKRGHLYKPVGIDYFFFPREIFTEIPAFAIGRPSWDNWMIYHAQQEGWTVVDVTPSVTVVHQEHGYGHLPGGRPPYDLEEAHQNIRLAGGYTKAYNLLDVNHHFSRGKIQRKPLTLPRLIMRLERWVMPEEKEGWRWQLTRMIRRLGRKFQ